MATPNVMMRTPPIAGPMTRAEFISTLLRLTALGNRSRPTISETKVWRAGLSNRLTKPSPAASAYTSHRLTEWLTTSTPRISARIPAVPWVA